MPQAFLPDRSVLSVTGLDARKFLQSVVTCDVDALQPGQAAFGALLTPQGKILFDFVIICHRESCAPSRDIGKTATCAPQRYLSVRSARLGRQLALSPRRDSAPRTRRLSRLPTDGAQAVDTPTFLLDTDAAQAPALVKRLTMYKLRAKVAITTTENKVIAVWGDDNGPQGIAVHDPRMPAMGFRVVDTASDVGDAAAYDAHRIACGIPKGGVDFGWGDAFPHEANMDLLHGVSFTKGCYVGQEVVSRMEHRGMARRRILRASFEGAPPAAGSEIRAGDTLLGTVGSSAAGHALVAVRTDRLADAQAADVSPTAAGVALAIAALPG